MKDRAAPETTVKKIDSRYSPHGDMGQQYLASGIHLALRKWDLEPGGPVVRSRRDYETVGFVIHGRAQLEVEGQTVNLEAGDSWLVPRNAEHCYTILESFSAIEATSPPAHVHERDAVPASNRPRERAPREVGWPRGRPLTTGRHHDTLATGRTGAMRPLVDAAMGRRDDDDSDA